MKKLETTISETENALMKIMSLARVLKLASVTDDYVEKYKLENPTIEDITDMIYNIASDTGFAISEIDIKELKRWR